MLGGLVTPADSMNARLSMGLTIASKLERECLGGCGVVVAQWSEHWRLKPEALGSIPGGCLDVFSSSKLSDVCLLYTSPSPRDATLSRMPSSA